MIKNDGPRSGDSRALPTQNESRVMPRDSALRAQVANSSFGNSGFAPSGFGNSGFSNSGFGPSGIVPTNAPGMPNTVIGLLQALQHADSPDSVKLTLGVAQWQVLAGYLQTFTMEEGQALIEQGSKDTTVYFIESGALNVYHTDANAQAHVAIIGVNETRGAGHHAGKTSAPDEIRKKLYQLKKDNTTFYMNLVPTKDQKGTIVVTWLKNPTARSRLFTFRKRLITICRCRITSQHLDFKQHVTSASNWYVI